MARTQALRQLIYVAALLLFLMMSLQAHAQNLQHRMSVQILPGLKMLKATDQIKFPAGSPKKISFLLNKKLQILSVDRASHVVLIHPGAADSRFNEWGLELGASECTLQYSGVLDTPVVNDQSDGLITPEGASFLAPLIGIPSSAEHCRLLRSA